MWNLRIMRPVVPERCFSRPTPSLWTAPVGDLHSLTPPADDVAIAARVIGTVSTSAGLAGRSCGSLLVGADQRGRPGRVVRRAVDEDVAIKVTRPVAVASRSFLVLVFTEKPSFDVVLTRVSSFPTPVHVTSKDTSCVSPRLSLTVPVPVAVTRLRFSVLVMVAGTVPAELNELPSGRRPGTAPLPLGPGRRYRAIEVLRAAHQQRCLHGRAIGAFMRYRPEGLGRLLEEEEPVGLGRLGCLKCQAPQEWTWRRRGCVVARK